MTARDAQPEKKNTLHLFKLLGGKYSESAKEVFGGQCLDALHEESALPQKVRGHCNLKLRATRGGEMRYDTN